MTRYNRRMYRVAVIALLLVFAGLQYRLWIGDGSLAQVHQLQSMQDEITEANAKDRVRNDAMQVQINDLKSGVDATEGRARDEMGMVKPGETFFLTIPAKSEQSVPHDTRDKTSDAG